MATTTPTLYDPKALALVSSLSTTANTVIYTAPANEAGVKIESIIVTNKTASAATITLKHNVGGTRYTIANAVSIPADGLPHDILAGIKSLYLAGGATADILDGSAGTASALDVHVHGLEMKD